MKRPVRAMVVGAVLLLPGSMLLARAGWVAAKGAVGGVLIDRALAATLADGVARAPWRWADMHPVARLRVPRLGVARPVLSNASGSAMAFGIGHVDGTSEPGAHGTCVLAGHRDSWAAFVFDLKAGDEVALDAPRAPRATAWSRRDRPARRRPRASRRRTRPARSGHLLAAARLAALAVALRRAVRAFDGCRYFDFWMTPHATRPPALPVGWVVKSSSLAWTITERPTTSLGLPSPTVQRSVRT
jgi:sortase A